MTPVSCPVRWLNATVPLLRLLLESQPAVRAGTQMLQVEAPGAELRDVFILRSTEISLLDVVGGVVEQLGVGLFTDLLLDPAGAVGAVRAADA